MLRRTGAGVAGVSAAIIVALSACSGTSTGNAEPSELERFTPAPASAAPFTSTAVPGAPGAAPVPAASPQAAVEGYLAAEIAGDQATSFSLLAAAQRDKLVDLAAWRAAHVNLPVFESYTLQPVTESGAVVTDVALQPRLDAITGVVPARATITWRPVAEDGGWRVDLAGATFEPHYPDDAGAAPAALAWVQARQACQADPEASRLLLDPALAAALCRQPGRFEAGMASPLSALANPTPVVDAYGPGASAFARVVRLTGPATLDVVTAPLGADWVVISVTS